MHFTRKNVVGKNMIFSIQNSNAKRQPMNTMNPLHAASPRLQFQYSKPNIRQNTHLMSNNMQYSVVKPKGQRLWSPVVHQKLKTRMYCNTVYECDADYGTCSVTKNGKESYEYCSNTCVGNRIWKCDENAGQCKIDKNNGKMTHTQCTAAGGCVQKMYTCDKDAGKCKVDPQGSLTHDACTAAGGCVQNKYKCDPDLGTCKIDAAGTPQTKAACDSACAQNKYKCDPDLGTCKIDTAGTPQTKATCDSACVQNKYKCDPDLGTCKIDAAGTPQTKAACDSACAQNKYKCDPDLGTCKIDTAGTPQTKATCDSACVQNKYKCNPDLGTCKIDAAGTPQTKATCDSACAQNKYKCDPDLGTCKIDTAGTPQTKATCDSACVQNKYKCNPDLGTCKIDAAGTPQTKATCDSACVQQMYTCDKVLGQCNVDPTGTQTKESCSKNCYIHYSCDTTEFDASFTCKPDASGQRIDECSQSCIKHYDCCGNTGTCIVAGLSGEYIDSSTCNASCEQDLYRCDTSNNYTCELQTDPLTFNKYKDDTCIAANTDAFYKYYDQDLAQCKIDASASYHSTPGTGFFLSWRPPRSNQGANLGSLAQCVTVHCTVDMNGCFYDASCALHDITSTTSITTMKKYEASTNTNEKNLATCILKEDCGPWVGKGACRIRNNTSVNDPSGNCSGNDVYYGMMNYEQCVNYCKTPE